MAASSTPDRSAAGTRLLLERSIHDDFVAELVRRARAMKVGPGRGPHLADGAPSSADQLATAERYVALGLQEGATLPAVATGSDRRVSMNRRSSPLCPTRCALPRRRFGPVLCVIPFETEAEAIHIANDTIYGLAARMDQRRRQSHARSPSSARRHGLGEYLQLEPAPASWGGYKQSGVGRELGALGLDEFTEVKSIIVDTSGKPKDSARRAEQLTTRTAWRRRADSYPSPCSPLKDHTEILGPGRARARPRVRASPTSRRTPTP